MYDKSSYGSQRNFRYAAAPKHADGYEREDIIIDESEPKVTKLWAFDRLPPAVWRVEGMIREGYLSLVAAHAGVGKSFVALYLSLCLAVGIPFFGRKTVRSRVLYIDYEMDAEEQMRRLSQIAAGAGISLDDERLRGHLYYHRPKYALSTFEGMAEVKKLVNYFEIDFLVVDSLTFALGAADASAAKDVVPVLLELQDLGISGLVLDHFSKAAAQGNHAFATPFGSTMKFAVARSVYNLTRADGGGLLLQATKSNFGPSDNALCYEMEFDGETGPIIFREVERGDPAMSGSSQHLRAHDVTLVAVEAIHAETGGPATQQQVVEWRAAQGDERLIVSLGAVRNHFTALKKRGKIVTHESGGYLPAHREKTPDVFESAPATSITPLPSADHTPDDDTLDDDPPTEDGPPPVAETTHEEIPEAEVNFKQAA